MTDHNKEFVDCWPAIEILNERLAEYETNPSPQIRIDILDTIGDLAAIRIELDEQIEHAEQVLDGAPIGRGEPERGRG